MTASPENSNDQFADDFRRARQAIDEQAQAEERAAQRALERETDSTLARRPLRTLAQPQGPSSMDEGLDTERDRVEQLADEAFQRAMQPDKSEPRQRSIAMF